MIDHPMIRASREAFGYEPEDAPIARPWLAMALGVLTVVAQLGIIVLILWRPW